MYMYFFLEFGKANNIHSCNTELSLISIPLMFSHQIMQYFQNMSTLGHFIKKKCGMVSMLYINISKSLGILNTLKRILPEEIEVMLYNFMIASHIHYYIIAWGYEFKRITKLHKLALRIISISKYNAHTSPIFKRLKLLKIEDIIKLNKMKFLYKYENRNLLCFFKKKLALFSACIMKYTTSTQEETMMYSLLKQTTNMQTHV